MKWLEKLELLDYGALIIKERALVVSDLQLGYERQAIKTGVTIPRNQFAKTLERLDRMIESAKPKTVIIAGDVQHDFSGIDFETGLAIKQLIKHLTEKNLEIIFVKGNHDTMLSSFLKREGYELFDEHETRDFTVIHGHKETASRKPVIMGHEHPAILLTDEFGKKHKYKCHLAGDKILVIPSISVLATGTVVNKNQKPLSPLLHSYDELTPIVNGLRFPKISKLKEIA